MTSCTACLHPCPLHGVTGCLTCHKHPGECQFGDCLSAATHRLTYRGEVRDFCTHHTTGPAYGFARVGATIEEIAQCAT